MFGGGIIWSGATYRRQIWENERSDSGVSEPVIHCYMMPKNMYIKLIKWPHSIQY